MNTPTRKAIIVAAGRGRRLGQETDAIPKCMVKVAGRPILHWQLDALAAIGVEDVVVVRGYLGDRIDGGAGLGSRLRFVDNADWAHNNILASLACAAAEMRGGFFFSYSDIVYAADVTRALAAATKAGDDASGVEATRVEAALVIDRRWQEAYVGRTLHPVSEAELARVDGDHVVRVGKRLVAEADAAGEFIGLAWFSDAAATSLQRIWSSALAAGGPDAPFGAAAALRNAYLTDGLNAMIEQGARLRVAYIDGGWREIDTEQDLANAERVLARWPR